MVSFIWSASRFIFLEIKTICLILFKLFSSAALTLVEENLFSKSSHNLWASFLFFSLSFIFTSSVAASFIYLNKKCFGSKIMLDKLMCIYHSLTMEVSLLQIINTKKLTKPACWSRVVVQYVNIKILLFYKEYFINLYQMNSLETK